MTEMQQGVYRYRWTIGIVIVTAIALGLRLWGIEWGLPNTLHYFSYHTDETVVLEVSRTSPGGLNLFAGQILPHFYDYPSLQFYLVNIVLSVTNAYLPSPHPGGSPVQLLYTGYLVGRLLTVLMGTGTVWALWAFGRRVYGEAAGLLGALLLAITPLHAQHSHFLTVDVPATFWLVLTLLWSAKALSDESKVRALVIAGFFAGFAAATKYNCALVMLPVLVAVFLPGKSDLKSAKSLKLGLCILVVGVSLIGYLIGCPGTLLESSRFVADFHKEAVHVSSQQELWFQGTGIGWWYIISRNLADGMGLPLLIASLAGAVYAVRKREAGDLLTISLALPYYLLVGSAVSRYARYEIPLLPVLALWAARLLIDSSLLVVKTQRLAIQAATAAIVLATASSTAVLLLPMSQPDNRDRAAAWLFTHVPTSTLVGTPVEPWFWTAPLDTFFNLPGVGQWRKYPGSAPPYSPYVTNPAKPFDVDLLRRMKPTIVTMSEMEYYDRLRLHDAAARAYMQEIKSSYNRPLVFAAPHWLGGQKSIDGLPCQDLPFDMLYTSPTTLIFTRK